MSFGTFVLEQLGRGVHGVRGQHVLHPPFKVDESNRPEFEARGMGPFRPYGEDGEVMQYYRVPDDLLEDPEALGQWAERAR
jgi:TfoX/Sxy family transcriptional regulator of competence genes